MIVAKINFVKSKGIKFVILERLMALVQKKLPRVAVIAIKIRIMIIKMFDGVSQTYNEGKNVIGVIITTKVNISVITFSSLDNFLTISPVIAWVKDDIKAMIVPISKLISGLIITIVNKKPRSV